MDGLNEQMVRGESKYRKKNGRKKRLESKMQLNFHCVGFEVPVGFPGGCAPAVGAQGRVLVRSDRTDWVILSEQRGVHSAGAGGTGIWSKAEDKGQRSYF